MMGRKQSEPVNNVISGIINGISVQAGSIGTINFNGDPSGSAGAEKLAELLTRLNDQMAEVKGLVSSVPNIPVDDVDATGVDDDSDHSIIPVGNELAQIFASHHSAFDEGTTMRGKTILEWFCHALALVIVDESSQSGDGPEGVDEFVEWYGLRVLAKLVESVLTGMKLNPFERFDSENLGACIDQVRQTIFMFHLQGSVRKIDSTACLRAHFNNSTIVGWSMAHDPALRMDIAKNGVGTLSSGGGVYEKR